MPLGRTERILRLVYAIRHIDNRPVEEVWNLVALARALGVSAITIRYLFDQGFLDGKYVRVGMLWVHKDAIPIIERALLTLVRMKVRGCKTRLCYVSSALYGEICEKLSRRPAYLSVLDAVMSRYASAKYGRTFIVDVTMLPSIEDPAAVKQVRRMLCQ